MHWAQKPCLSYKNKSYAWIPFSYCTKSFSHSARLYSFSVCQKQTVGSFLPAIKSDGILSSFIQSTGFSFFRGIKYGRTDKNLESSNFLKVSPHASFFHILFSILSKLQGTETKTALLALLCFD